jgi:hypothetical protein
MLLPIPSIFSSSSSFLPATGKGSLSILKAALARKNTKSHCNDSLAGGFVLNSGKSMFILTIFKY